MSDQGQGYFLASSNTIFPIGIHAVISRGLAHDLVDLNESTWFQPYQIIRRPVSDLAFIMEIGVVKRACPFAKPPYGIQTVRSKKKTDMMRVPSGS
jgi:hypothetical protein